MTRKITKKKLIKILKGDKKQEQMEDRYQSLADCIRSDQVPASDVAKFFSDKKFYGWYKSCLLYTSPSPRDNRVSRMPSSA